MTIDIIVPAAGESVKEADVVNWFKESGAFVSVNEPLVALETEKATLELVAEQSGILDIMVPSGVVSVGDVIARIVSSDVSPSPAPTASAPVTQANTPPPASDVPARMGNASPNKMCCGHSALMGANRASPIPCRHRFCLPPSRYLLLYPLLSRLRMRFLKVR